MLVLYSLIDWKTTCFQKAGNVISGILRSTAFVSHCDQKASCKRRELRSRTKAEDQGF